MNHSDTTRVDRQDPPERTIASVFSDELERCGKFERGQARPPKPDELTPLNLEEYRKEVAKLPEPAEDQIRAIIRNSEADDDFNAMNLPQGYSIVFVLLPYSVNGIPFSKEETEKYGYLLPLLVSPSGYYQSGSAKPNGAFFTHLLPREVAEAGRVPVNWPQNDPNARLPENFEKLVFEAVSRVMKAIRG